MFEYVEADNNSQAIVPLPGNQSLAFPLRDGKLILSLDECIELWLQTTYNRSRSERTLEMYKRTMRHFRSILHHAKTDLDGDPNLIAILAQKWASSSWPGTASSRNGDELSSSTFNNRVGAISSFYEFAIIYDVLPKNPMKRIRRRPKGDQDYARAFEDAEIQHMLGKIDRSTIDGLRDYALLSLGLTTGRRRSELVSVKWGDFRFMGQKVILTFPRCKGNKRMIDELRPDVRDNILAYIMAVHGDDLKNLPPDTPVWLSHAVNASYHQPLEPKSLRNICLRHLGTGKTHSLRRTFAQSMRKAGAELETVRDRLGHENISTTDTYTRRDKSAENPFAESLNYGIDTNRPEMRNNRFDEIKQTLRDHPELSNSEIARRFGVTKQNVSIHRKALGLPPSAHKN